MSAAYYALEHAACAAILLYGGVGAAKGFPKSHRDIIQHIGTLSAGDPELGEFGDILNEVYSLRETADYNVTRHPVREDADFAIKSATELLALCKEKWKSDIDPG